MLSAQEARKMSDNVLPKYVKDFLRCIEDKIKEQIPLGKTSYCFSYDNRSVWLLAKAELKQLGYYIQDEGKQTSIHW